jgi:drug/metabolite transporter (DMT)-like permease
LLVVGRKLLAGTEVSVLTVSATVFALLAITAGTLYQKRFVRSTDVRTANLIQLAAALVVTWPLSQLETEPMVWNLQLIAAMAWAVLALIQRGAATAVTSLFYLVPPTTAVMAWLLFDELITLTTVLGTALTALGVALVVRQPSPKD